MSELSAEQVDKAEKLCEFITKNKEKLLGIAKRYFKDIRLSPEIKRIDKALKKSDLDLFSNDIEEFGIVYVKLVFALSENSSCTDILCVVSDYYLSSLDVSMHIGEIDVNELCLEDCIDE